MGLTAVLVLAAAAGHGCQKKAGRDSQAPETAAPAGGAEAPAAEAPGGEAEKKSLDFAEEPLPDDIEAIEDRLTRAEDELLRVGVGEGETAPTAAAEDRDRCTRVCDLAESICDLEGKICDLAERHEGDERYAKACDRAEKHCERATEVCTACAG